MKPKFQWLFFFHSWLSFGSRSMIWGYSCCQKFSLPPVSVPWAAEPVGGVCFGLVWCRNRVEVFRYFSFPVWFYQGLNTRVETWRKGAHRIYVREVELDMVVPAGHCPWELTVKDRQGKLGTASITLVKVLCSCRRNVTQIIKQDFMALYGSTCRKQRWCVITYSIKYKSLVECTQESLLSGTLSN